MGIDLNNRQLSRMAARRLLEHSAIGKALKVVTPGEQKKEADYRLQEMETQMAKVIEETYRPYCNEAFQ